MTRAEDQAFRVWYLASREAEKAIKASAAAWRAYRAAAESARPESIDG